MFHIPENLIPDFHEISVSIFPSVHKFLKLPEFLELLAEKLKTLPKDKITSFLN